MKLHLVELTRRHARSALLVLGLAALPLATGCSDPAAGVTKAEVGSAKVLASASGGSSASPASPAKPAEAPRSPERPATAVDLAAGTSTIGFVGSKVTASHEGSFEKWTGWISVDGDDPTTAKGFIDIDVSSLKIDPEKLAGHLKSADFFDVGTFPKATFTITGVKPGGEKGATHTVSGNLWIRGVEKGITFPATITVDKDTLHAKAEFAINRKTFGIVYAGKADDLIRDDVVIKLDLSGPRAAK